MRYRPGVSLAACGAAIGVMATALDAWAGINPPHAYGFCTTCHGQDLIGWVANRLFAARWPVSSAGAQAPILTAVGLLVGGFLAATLAGERQTRPARHAWRSLAAGVLASNLGLVALGCPVHQVILLGYGDRLALIAVVGFAIGAAGCTYVLKRRAARL